MSPSKPHARVAVAFASALVNADFERARSFLAPALRASLTPRILRKNLFGMFEGYAIGKPKSIHFDDEFVLDTWPDKRPDDIGWVYVGIAGDDFVEAVTVIVANVSGKKLIRNVEWGRP